MRSPDNLAKYAAGGRDRMAVAAGRDHFSPTNQPTSGNVCKNFSEDVQTTTTIQPTISEQVPFRGAFASDVHKAQMLALCNTFETWEKVLAVIQNSDRVIK